MPLTAVLERLYARRRFGIRPGVDRVGKLLGRLGNPEKKFRTIHVVGTNGKGSTSAFLSSILIRAGHRTAQFSSPHLVRFTERFRINGEEYPGGKLEEKLDTVLAAAPDDATFFEITTALAAYIFSDEGVDLAVMEAGMGGRSDATAALTGEMTIITPIALDHTDYLGSTIEEIAREKTGIIEPGTPVISAGQSAEVHRVIEEKCRLVHGALSFMGRDFSASWNSDGTLDYRGLSRHLAQLAPGLAGRYQAHNAAVALAAAEVLEQRGTHIFPSAFTQGVSSASWPGRMEFVPGGPPMLLDGAHNPAGSAALAESLSDYRYSRLLLVTGVCDDKDIEQIYAPLIPLAARIFTVTPAVDRAMRDEPLSRYFLSCGIEALPCGSVVAGIRAAQNEASESDLVLVCGSLFVVGEVKAWLERENYSGIRG